MVLENRTIPRRPHLLPHVLALAVIFVAGAFAPAAGAAVPEAAREAGVGSSDWQGILAARLVGAEQVTMQIQRHATRTCYSADLIDIKLATPTLFKAK